MKKTNVYIDGFNLYYGIRKTPYRWLDPLQLCQRILHGRNIHRLRYFTARVKARGPDNSIIRRQQTYLRALQTLPNVEIHFGAFLVSRTRMKVASPHPGGPATVEVIKTEEKGSDVNIASYLLLDAFRRDVETAVIISNDSDLVTPIDLVRSEFGLDVIVLNPHKNPSAELRRAATMVHQIRKGVLGSSQFPPQLT
ncbi:MAG TPA: NYN domain-containing protein, partial [Armatimonadota bacterium]|nr:NYN domain-containing protein [Armatimonadota bacterium]